MKIFKIAVLSTLFLTFAITSCYLYLLYKNNIDAPQPDRNELVQARDSGINWVIKNQDILIQDNNPALWWFLYESAKLTNNKDLTKLVTKYRTTMLDRNSVWSGYFSRTPAFNYVSGSLNSFEKYQQFFIYGLTCDKDLGEEKAIREQLNINFCNWKPFFSSCSTHQFMGLRLLQTKKCGEEKLYKQLSSELANEIQNQLIWDPRIGDVYIQRVLTLHESGHKDKIKPIWLQQILAEQRADGGWANFYKLFSIGTTEFGFDYVLPAIHTKPSNSFHTTAQAIFLLSLSTQE